MIKEGGELVGFFFTQEMFAQWKKIYILVEYYLFIGMDYWGDLEMPRPPVQVWGPNGTYT